MTVEDQENRIRKIFQLSKREALPTVSMDSLEKYQNYLERKLLFPFNAIYESEKGFMKYHTVEFIAKELVPFKDIPEDGFYGLFCRGKSSKGKVIVPIAEVEDSEKGDNYTLISDYNLWFWNYR